MWRLCNRVAQGEVEDILFAILGLESDASLEHPSDPTALVHEAPDFF